MRTRIKPIGSLGSANDLRIMLQAACYEEGVQGHQWENQYTDEPSPAHPKCKFCQRTMRSKMSRRGMSDQEIQVLFTKIEAPWPWGKRSEKVSVHKPKERPAKEYRPGDNITWVGELTAEMEEANAKQEAAWDHMIEARGALIDQGATADQAAEAHPMPKLPIYRAGKDT